ncbi:RidA family protein [Nakamurella silvestris]|nr:RidA family protein [Nakamurella silvestris]
MTGESVGAPGSEPVRRNHSSGGPWEAAIGYSRAVRTGPLIVTAGCTATVDGAVVHVGDPYQQTLVAFGIALDAVRALGAEITDVISTRMYITDLTRSGDVGRAHGSLFGDVRPAATMVGVAGLIDPDHLVEVEVTAWHPAG